MPRHRKAASASTPNQRCGAKHPAKGYVTIYNLQSAMDTRRATMTSAETLYADAQRYFPGGVTATARVNAAIGRPFYVARGDGPYVYDLDGREYVDLCISHGASLLGHNHSRIRDAVARALELGMICAYETEHHVALARLISDMVPCAEMVRFAGSGTE